LSGELSLDERLQEQLPGAVQLQMVHLQPLLYAQMEAEAVVTVHEATMLGLETQLQEPFV